MQHFLASVRIILLHLFAAANIEILPASDGFCLHIYPFTFKVCLAKNVAQSEGNTSSFHFLSLLLEITT